MDNFIMNHYMMKCHKKYVKNSNENLEEEYGYFCDIENDKTYYINDESPQYYPIPKKNNYKIIVPTLTTIEENKNKYQKDCDNSDNSIVDANATNEKTIIIVRVLFCILVFILLLS